MDKIIRNFKKTLVKVSQQVDKGIQQWETNDLHPLANQYVPKDTTALAESYAAARVPTPGLDMRYEIQYGNNLIGPDGRNYAADVHEWPNSKNWTTPGTGSKYLRRALRETETKLVPRVISQAKL
jgi:hypothetical protein